MIAQSHSQPIALPQQGHHYQSHQHNHPHSNANTSLQGQGDQLSNQYQQMFQQQQTQNQYLLQQQLQLQQQQIDQMSLSMSLSQSQQDYGMHKVGSYSSMNGDGDAFSPESFARQYIGSPRSWRMGSLGSYGGVGSFGPSSFSSRIPVGSPTAQLLNSIDFRVGKTPSSVESDSIMNAFNVFEREGELCRNYTCCGRKLNDLHALLEHFEEVHIVLVDRPSAQGPQAQIQVPFNPTVHDAPEAPLAQQQSQQMDQYQFHNVQQGVSGYGFDAADDMELDLDLDNSQSSHPPTSATSTASSRSSPSNSSRAPSPDTPISTPSAYPSPNDFADHQGQGQSSQQYISEPGSPLSASSAYPPTSLVSTRQSSPVTDGQQSAHQNQTGQQQQNVNGRPSLALNVNLNIPATGVGLGNLFPRSTATEGSGHNTLVVDHPETAFNAYARFASDYSSSMPGAQFNGATVDEASAVHMDLLNGGAIYESLGQPEGCVPPHLLFASITGVPGEQAGNGETVSGSESQEESGSEVEKKKGSKKDKGKGKSPQVARRLGKILLPITSTKYAAKMGSGSSATSANTQFPGLPLHAATAPTTPTQGPGTSSFATGTSTSNVSALGASQSQGPLGGRPSGSHTMPSTPNTTGVPSLLSSKPFRCPKPNCNKSYKQANGLKYHMTHGVCSYGPLKEMEHIHSILGERIREVSENGGKGSLTRSASLGSRHASGSSAGPSSQTEPSTPTTPLSPTGIMNMSYSDLSKIPPEELEELEKEAERRLRPFACGIGDCTRRYKNMNGLRYHYQHSGDHGVIGLNLLANGQHESLALSKRSHSHAHSSNSHHQQAAVTAGVGGVSRAQSTSSAASTSTVASSSNVLNMGLANLRTGVANSTATRTGTYPMYTMSGNVGGGVTTTTSTPGLTTKTTAIMPTTIQAQAFIVPNSNAGANANGQTAAPLNAEGQLSPLPLHLVNPLQRATGRTSPTRTSPPRFSPMSRPSSTSPRQQNAQAQRQQQQQQGQVPSPQQVHAQAQVQAQYNHLAAAYTHYANIQRQYAQVQQQAAAAQAQAQVAQQQQQQAQVQVQNAQQPQQVQQQQRQQQGQQQQDDFELEMDMDMDMGNAPATVPAPNASSPSGITSPRSPNAPGSGAGLYVTSSGEFVGERPSSVESYAISYMDSPQQHQQRISMAMEIAASPYQSSQQQSEQPHYQGGWN